MTGSELNIPENAVLSILVLDFDTLACEETSTTGFGQTGCRIRATRHRHVGKTLGLRIAGYAQMVKARITRVDGEDALVEYEFTDPDNQENAVNGAARSPFRPL